MRLHQEIALNQLIVHSYRPMIFL